MTPPRVIALLAATALISACSLRNVACGRPAPSQETITDPAAAPASGSSEPAEAKTFKIAFLGDSLTAGLGLLSQQAYPALVQDMFAAEGYTQVES